MQRLPKLVCFLRCVLFLWDVEVGRTWNILFLVAGAPVMEFPLRLVHQVTNAQGARKPVQTACEAHWEGTRGRGCWQGKQGECDCIHVCFYILCLFIFVSVIVCVCVCVCVCLRVFVRSCVRARAFISFFLLPFQSSFQSSCQIVFNGRRSFS